MNGTESKESPSYRADMNETPEIVPKVHKRVLYNKCGIWNKWRKENFFNK